MPGRLLKRRRRAERRRAGIGTRCGIIATAVVLSLYGAGIFTSLELSVTDWFFRMRGPARQTPEIVIIELDQGTIDTIGNWPVSRTIYARLLQILSRAGAHSVGFNIIFPEQSAPPVDHELAGAIAEAGMVFLPYYFHGEPGDRGYHRIVDNIGIFRDGAKVEGHVNMPPDSDGVVRRVLLDIPFEGKNHPQLAFLMACNWLGVGIEEIEVRPGRPVRLRGGSGETISIPLDARGGMVIDWNGQWRRVFRCYTVADIFDSEKRVRAGLPPSVPLEDLNDRICLVGLTAPGTFDAMRTPVEQLVPSIGIHAAILSQILQNRFLHAESRTMGFLIILTLGVGVSFLFPRLNPLVGIIAIVSASAAYILFAALVFFHYRAQIAILYPLSAMLLAYFSVSIQYEIAVSRERTRLQHRATHDGLTGLYVVSHFRLLLGAEIEEARKSGTPLCLIMGDIDHFKKLNDTRGHQAGDAVLKQIARILRSSCRDLDIVARYGGEEFIIVLPDTKAEEAGAVAERIRRTVEEHPFSHGGERDGVTISLGISKLGRYDSAGDLIERADEALYEAKRAGRNRVCIRH